MAAYGRNDSNCKLWRMFVHEGNVKLKDNWWKHLTLLIHSNLITIEQIGIMQYEVM